VEERPWNSSPRALESRPSLKVIEAITTTAGYRQWWTDDCAIGHKAGDGALFRFAGIEVAFRIDRVDARGIEMTCVRNRNYPGWQNPHLAIRALADAAGTYVDLVHDGYLSRQGCYDECVSGWDYDIKSLRTYCETGRSTPHKNAAQRTRSA
jgi:hypothetical protein